MARPEMEDIDALVIGGGPAGLTCAIYLRGTAAGSW
jgi:flavin-dependent dehydrogenase